MKQQHETFGPGYAWKFFGEKIKMVTRQRYLALPTYYMGTTINKKLWMGAGIFFCLIGAIGLILPLMPGLVFFIIASYCFARGSYKFLRMLISNKYTGPQIMDYKRGKGMAVSTKVIAIGMVLVSMIVSAFFMVKILWVKWAICITCIFVIAIILNQKTKELQ